MQAPLAELATRFEALHTEWRIAGSFGSSGTVQRQVEHGAPLEVIVLAAREPIDELGRQGLLVPGSQRLLARNELVLAVPASSTLQLRGVADLQNAEVQRIALGEPKVVPVGAYAAEALRSLGLYEILSPKLVHVSSARQATSHIEMGHVEAGFVYASDARSSPGIRIAAVIDQALHADIVYIGALIQRSVSSPGAALLLTFLCSDDAVEVFTRHGLLIRDTCAS